MTKVFTLVFVCLFLVGCGNNEEEIKNALGTAFAETEIAKPSFTLSPTQTSTATTTPTNTVTSSPIPTETPTHTQTPVTSFNEPIETTMDNFADWYKTKFDFIYNLNGADFYEAKDVFTGSTIWVLGIDGYTVGFMVKLYVDDELYDVLDQLKPLMQAYTYYAGVETNNWLSENMPYRKGETNTDIVCTDNGCLVISINKDEDVHVFIFGLLDLEYAERVSTL